LLEVRERLLAVIPGLLVMLTLVALGLLTAWVARLAVTRLGRIFGVDRAVVVVRKEVWQQLPERTRRVLGRVRLGISVATELERQMVVESKPAEQVARSWMAANPAKVDVWFAD
jgi:ABC-type proline/glycine betaine transport system substrate-binding protein